MKKLFFLLALAPLGFYKAQQGGIKYYRFLDLPMTARAAALGGNNMSIWGDDIQLIYSNPALLNPSMSNQAALDFSNYVGDMKYGFAAYGHALKNKACLAGSIQFFDYGKFQAYDELGTSLNTFKASDYSLNLHYAKPMADSMFNIGVALKTILSQYDIYQSYATAVDLGVTYRNRKRLVLSILAKNIGFIWKDYNNSTSQNGLMPFALQFGLSYKVAKAPFRLFMVYDHLEKWRLDYISPIDTAGQYSSLDGSKKDTTGWQKFGYATEDFLDNAMRHIVFGTEIIISKNFHLRIAYNYKRQREMILPDRRGINGLSVGFGFKIKRFGFSYAFNKMAFPGNSSLFGVSLTL
ncbi:MAG TPA: type IX secretion system protein PorQ [Bacteroidia bacterium]|nr:type IX secretion system protein PorQ [Bacteroidia bacterium]